MVNETEGRVIKIWYVDTGLIPAHIGLEIDETIYNFNPARRDPQQKPKGPVPGKLDKQTTDELAEEIRQLFGELVEKNPQAKRLQRLVKRIFSPDPSTPTADVFELGLPPEKSKTILDLCEQGHENPPDYEYMSHNCVHLNLKFFEQASVPGFETCRGRPNEMKRVLEQQIRSGSGPAWRVERFQLAQREDGSAYWAPVEGG